MQQAEMKRRREEEKGKQRYQFLYKRIEIILLATAKLLSHQNGELMESPHLREKHHQSRVQYFFTQSFVFIHLSFQEKSPYLRERQRSHDKIELREKQYPFY